ncbi:HNH endonuclease signature motif containing protein [Streptomyces globosus]|uniref:HNH endonuclease n=1 Tax=Streptomyces globosus TaxID=68209 RepID=UPI0031E108CE
MPTAPPSRCTDPECYELASTQGRCTEHQPIAWRGRDDKAGRYGISSGVWRTLKRRVSRRDSGCCWYCGGEPEDGETLHLDHKTPVSEGGAITDLENLGLIHAEPCHQQKSKAEALRGNERRWARRESSS